MQDVQNFCVSEPLSCTKTTFLYLTQKTKILSSFFLKTKRDFHFVAQSAIISNTVRNSHTVPRIFFVINRGEAAGSHGWTHTGVPFMESTTKLTLKHQILLFPLLIGCCMCHMFYWFGYLKDSKLQQPSKPWSVPAALQREFDIKCSITILENQLQTPSCVKFC